MTDFVKAQQDICKKYNTSWNNIDFDFKIGVADNVFTDNIPINGLRHIPKGETTGWFIWSGETFSEADDFFKPYCIKHLIRLKPEIIKYLALPAGYRFLIDNKGYEDVWEDVKLKEIE